MQVRWEENLALIRLKNEISFLIRTGKYMARVYVLDPDFRTTTDDGKFCDFEFNLMAQSPDLIPPLAEGAVLRIHHMALQEYNGVLNGRVYDSRSVVSVLPDPAGGDGGGGADGSDRVVPRFTSNPETLHFGPSDEAKVRELRLWWRLRGTSHDLALTEHELTFSSLRAPCTFDVYCYVTKKVCIQRNFSFVTLCSRCEHIHILLRSFKYFDFYLLLSSDQANRSAGLG